MEEIPFGYCHCGCGGKTKISNWTDKRIGAVKGQPYRYINGHSTRVPVDKRFWSYVEKSGDCWEWTGYRDGGGYGVLLVDRKLRKAHRVSWTLTNGPIPKGLNVLHKCDNPRCIRPDHLFLGTQNDNMKDCARKGRLNPTPQYGETNPMAVLTDQKVIEMRRLRSETGMPYKKIALRYGVTTMTAFRATTGQLWKHLTEGL